jgi:hypothetical protein
MKKSAWILFSLSLSFLLLLNACGPITPAGTAAPAQEVSIQTAIPSSFSSEPHVRINGVWSDAAAIYSRFFEESIVPAIEETGYLESGHFVNSVNGISLLDLDFNGSPELILYLRGGSSDDAAIFTLENGEVCCFTELSGSILMYMDVPLAQNALDGVVAANLYSLGMVDAFIQDCLAFLIFTVQDSGEQVFLLNDQVSGEFHQRSIWLQFGQKDGALYAEELCKYEKYGEWHYETEKKNTFYVNDMKVSQEEYDLFEMEWKKSFQARYKFTENINYMDFTERISDYPHEIALYLAFFNQYIIP